ncbi:MAG: YqaE/Pmp3 family membrane protein [Desulfamplus sp.]|nr:YqaE/Pmp3 family membrane protein [Desulfamplus sp.]
MKENEKDFFRIILSVIIPPVGVFLQVGLGLHFWINIVLTLLGYIPGLIHAIWIITREENHGNSKFQDPF